MWACDLARFLAGRQKIVLLPNGPVDVALLARLVTPGTFVQQAASIQDLERFAAFEGPGIAAVVPEGAARFVHDPTAGETSADRLTIESMPRIEDVHAPRGVTGGLSTEWQRDGLRHLSALASGSAKTAAPAEAQGAADAGPATPLDKLAAWLVSQTDMSGA